MRKVDILNFEWNAMSRDSNIVEPVLCYLEQKYGLNIVRENYDNYMLKLITIRPKMVVVSNYVGAPENFQLVKQAHNMGIKVVSLISEGNVSSEELAGDFFWGWNDKKEIVIDLLLLWSERTKRIFLDKVPESRDMNMEVSGATGFDIYKLLAFMKKEDFLKKYRKNQKKVVGIAAWGFEKVNLEGKSLAGTYPYTVEESEYLLDAKERINRLYDSLISNNPDTLFILKYHPANVECPEETEFVGLNKYENVVEIGRQEQISDLINVSDVWMAFESTTTLEAWLMGKCTIAVNPLGRYFPRAQIYDGSLELHSVDEVQDALDEFYDIGIIKGFESIENVRKAICQEMIQFSDGKNHVRAAEEIIKIFDKDIRCSLKLSREALKEVLVEIKYGILGIVPIVKNSQKVSRYNNRKNRDYYSERLLETKRYTEAILSANEI